jgi:hypothetical protein
LSVCEKSVQTLNGEIERVWGSFEITKPFFFEVLFFPYERQIREPERGT